MADQENKNIRMRFVRENKRILYKVLFKHAMNTEHTSKEREKFYIKGIQFYLRNRMVMQADTTVNLSTDFVLMFYLDDAKKGDDFRVHWVDNRGHQQSYATKVTFYEPKKK